MSTERNGITGDAGSSGIETNNGFIEGHRDISDGGSTNIAPGQGGGDSGIDPYNGDISREGWGGLTTYTPWG